MYLNNAQHWPFYRSVGSTTNMPVSYTIGFLEINLSVRENDIHTINTRTRTKTTVRGVLQQYYYGFKRLYYYYKTCQLLLSGRLWSVSYSSTVHERPSYDMYCFSFDRPCILLSATVFTLVRFAAIRPRYLSRRTLNPPYSKPPFSFNI